MKNSAMRVMYLMVILLTSLFASAQSDAPEYFMAYAEELSIRTAPLLIEHYETRFIILAFDQ